MKKEGILKFIGIVGIALLLIILAGQNVVSKQTHIDIKKNLTQDNNTKIDLSIGSSGSGKSIIVNIGSAKKANIQYLKEPPKLTTEQIKRFQESTNNTHLPGPKLPKVKPYGPGHKGNETILKTLQFTNTNISALPGDFWIFQNSATGMGGSDVNEPSVAQNGNDVFYTGNWYAALSTDGGNTFSYINPFTDMPTFCCDQDVIYDPSRDMTIWYRQGIKEADGSNFFRLMVFDNKGESWYWDIWPTDLDGNWQHQWWDYPQLALSNNNLIISSNIFDKSKDWQRTVLLKLSLDQLLSKRRGKISYIPWTGNFNFGLTSGDTDVIYWGTHASYIPRSKIRIFSWAENSGTFFWYDKDIDHWEYTDRGDAHCPSPDGLNWCGRTDSRMTGGWVANGIIGFLWNVKEGNGFNYPYIEAATFRESDKLYLGRPNIWNDNYAVQYGNVYPIFNGALGATIAWGGGNYYPSSAVLISDEFTGRGIWSGVITGSGIHGSKVWGDYLRVRPYIPSNRIWVATGYTSQKDYKINPQYIVFGRYQNRIIPLKEALDYTSNSYLGTWTTGGSAFWYGQALYFISGGSSAKSDKISDGQDTWLQNTINGPGYMSFNWAVQSEYYDFLEFYIDNNLISRISGVINWQPKTFYIGPGIHTLKWRYVKDDSGTSSGDTAYVDNFRFHPELVPDIFLYPNPINSGGSSKVIVLVKDPDNNPISGANVTLYTYGNGSVSPTTGTTDNRGFFISTYYPPSVISTSNFEIDASTRKSDFNTGFSHNRITVRPKLSIASAVDNGQIKWSTGGNKPWFGEDTTNYYYGGDAAQSGPIVDCLIICIPSINSWVQGNVTGPGQLNFYWKVDTLYKHHYLRFYIDNVYKTNITGTTGWLNNTYNIGNGKHTLKWIYEKGYGFSTGLDAGWLDKVTYNSLYVTYPNGGEIFNKGSTKTIKWSYTGNSGSYIKIELLKGGILNRLITSNTSIGKAGTGSYTWSISPTQSLANNYKIRITSKSNSFYKDLSDKNFTISK